MILSSAYRPPNTSASNFVSDFELFLVSLKKSGMQSIIGMDHNLDFLKHSCHRPTQDFLELIISHDYLSSITKPTHIMHSSSTLTDNIFAKSNLSNSISSEILVDDISDHMPCITSIKNIDKCIQAWQFIEKRKITKQSLNKIKSDLSVVNWYKMLQSVTTEHGFNLFHSKLDNILESHAPIKKTIVKSKKFHQPWIMGGIQNSIRKQKLLYKKSLSSSDEKDRSNYKDYQTCLNKIKQVSKVAYY